ncbi:CD276 antigen homolog isoform X2 [Ictalurus punctatus]|uniref:CD276 antigen homolog isoform X2 n=1 Tax=Ictalurus punctatus TaxID=7998 RepID=A0A9F7TEX9_ICTPU|nr:CD276 antigen homolog isoform X2 [Ictalurus punctatus]
MEIRSYLLFALLLVIDKVSMQSVTVEADIGGSVILPCSVGRYEKDVFWRNENSKSVYDIITGEVDFHDQDAVYRDRVDSFPSEFAKGNYSIRLRNVKPTDPGPYSCHIPNSITVYVQLKIKERRVLEPTPKPGNSGTMKRASGTSLFLLICVLLRSLAD